jgi:hypothetical protein
MSAVTLPRNKQENVPTSVFILEAIRPLQKRTDQRSYIQFSLATYFRNVAPVSIQWLALTMKAETHEQCRSENVRFQTQLECVERL